jgi:hypothetical protein
VPEHPKSQQKLQFFPQKPPQPSDTARSRHWVGQNGSQHAEVSKEQVEVHANVPRVKPCDTQVCWLRLVPSQLSPVPITPSPQQRSP